MAVDHETAARCKRAMRPGLVSAFPWIGVIRVPGTAASDLERSVSVHLDP